MPALIHPAMAAYNLDAFGHLKRFADLYPSLWPQIHTHAYDGFRFERPCIGFIHDGDFVFTCEACALGDMSPVDSVLLDTINHEDGTLRHLNTYRRDVSDNIIGSADLDAVLRVVQGWACIGGDGAALFFGEDADSEWRMATREERRAALLAYLTYESASLSEDEKRTYNRADAAGE